MEEPLCRESAADVMNCRQRGDERAGGPGLQGPGKGICTDLKTLGCCCCKYWAKTSSPEAHAWRAEGRGVPGWSLLQDKTEFTFGCTNVS